MDAWARVTTATGGMLRTLKRIAVALVAIVGLGVAWYAYLVLSFDTETLPANHGRVNKVLYLGPGERQPLLVGFGGSEGGNAWTRTYLKAQRERFLAQGYALLALAYFGEEGIPKDLDRISLDGVYAAIVDAASNPKINGDCIGLIGGSKGAELALALASRYPVIKTVVAVVPGHAVFPAHTLAMNTPSFTSAGEPLPFVPMPWTAAPALLQRDIRGAWERMIADEEAVRRAAIAVEQINGPILFLSATRDEFWPSTEMSEEMMRRLQANRFPHRYEHVAVQGDHAAPQQRGDLVEEFLRANLLAESASGCARS